MKIAKLLVSLVAGIVMATASQAASVLYFADDVQGTDAMAAALSGSSHTVVTATSYGDFSTQVGVGGWDLVVYFQQNNTDVGAVNAISGWVTGGGKAIFTDWTRNAAVGSLFDATYTGSNNQTSVNITSALFAAGVTNPVSLSNPGWGIFSIGMAASAGGTSAATFGNGNDAIVIGNGGTTIINGFLSDTMQLAAGTQLYANQLAFLLDGPTSEVPEPGSLALLGLGLVGLAAMRKRKQA